MSLWSDFICTVTTTVVEQTDVEQCRELEEDLEGWGKDGDRVWRVKRKMSHHRLDLTLPLPHRAYCISLFPQEWGKSGGVKSGQSHINRFQIRSKENYKTIRGRRVRESHPCSHGWLRFFRDMWLASDNPALESDTLCDWEFHRLYASMDLWQHFQQLGTHSSVIQQTNLVMPLKLDVQSVRH